MIERPPPTIIVTRPEPDAQEFAALAAARGYHAILSPVMSIEYLDAAPPAAPAFAFTSANGVRAFIASGGDATGARAYAVGEITAAAARSAGFPGVIAAAGDVGSLAETIAACKERGPLVHVCGEARAGDLAAALAERGVAAARSVLYRQVRAESLSAEAIGALRASAEVWVAFFSPRAARLFAELAAQAGLPPVLSSAGAACLSEAVAEAAGERWRSVAIASERNAKSLLDAIDATQG